MSAPNPSGKAASSFMVYALASVANVLLSYMLLVVFANYLTKDAYAQFGLYNTIFALVLIVFNFGHKETLFKASSMDDGMLLQSGAQTYLLWQLMWLGLCALCWLFNPLLGVIALNFIVINWLYVAASVHRGRRHYARDALILPLQRAIWLIGCFWVFHLLPDSGLWSVFSLSLLAAVITFLLLRPSAATLPLRLPNPFSWFWQTSLTTRSLLWKYCLIELTTVAYLKLDMPFLSYFATSPDLMADYYLSNQIFEAAVLVISPIGFFFFNRYAQLKQQEMPFKRFVQLAGLYTGLMGGLILCGHLLWWLIGQWLLETMFSGYAGSFELVMWNLSALYLIALNIILSNYLIVNHKERGYMKVCLLALVVNLLGNGLLIPLWSLQGAVVTRILTELAMSLALLGYVYVMWRKQRLSHVAV